MAPTFALLALALSLSSYVRAFSPDQCNVTTYGKPDRVACNTLLTSISKLGVGNTSYLFIPVEFPTPTGISNATRKNFPQSWSTPGCNAALVPIEVTASSVTYDTTSYSDLAAAGTVVVQQCISNSTGGGGWELAGDNEELVLHIYATGSQIDQTIKKETPTDIAATSEDEIDDAEIDDPDFDDISADGDFGDSTAVSSGLPITSGTAVSSGKASSPQAITSAAAQVQQSSFVTSAAPVSSAVPAGAAKAVPSSGTFNYLGCQADSSASSHTLSSLQWSGTGLTVQRCAAYCASYQYMGVEAGSQCYCGGDANGKGVKPATLVTSTTNKCTTPCNGDATQLCGGTGWLTVYQNTKSATAGATA